MAAGGTIAAAPGAPSPAPWFVSLGVVLGKLTVMVVLLYMAGSRFIPWVLIHVAKVKSRELFTLTVLVLSIAVATGASALFGASVALGAFLAVIGRAKPARAGRVENRPL